MIQSIYTSVKDANLVSCGKKGLNIKSDPIPLIRDKFLGEYRTELERAKVRKNLGIKDDQSITWGQLDGVIEEQKDLINYIELKWQYESDLDSNIKNVGDALDYVIHYVKTFKSEAEDVAKLFEETTAIKKSITELDDTLSDGILLNLESIQTILNNINNINEAIKILNEKLLTINVDKNILEWMKNAVEGSNSMYLTETNKLDVNISKDVTNAVKVLDLENPGIYVKDLSENVSTIENTITSHSTSLEQINEELDAAVLYQTELSDETSSPDKIGGIELGTTVSQLKGKTITQILDYILFPTVVRDLIMPSIYYSQIDTIVEVNAPLIQANLIFIKNDAGEENGRNESITYRGIPVSIEKYNNIGEYIYTGIVSYDAGEYLLDNKGLVSDIRVEAGSQQALFTVTATYPWYAGNSENAYKLELVPFNQSTEVELSLSGLAVIKLPGTQSELESFKVDAGMGFLEVDLNSWLESTEYLNNYTYKVWRKNEPYTNSFPHKIKFKLIE